MKLFFSYIILILFFLSACTKEISTLPFDTFSIADSITIQDIAFADDSIVYAVGGIKREYGCIYKSTDGGTQWNLIESTESRLNSIYLQNQSKGMFCGDEQEGSKLCFYRLENDSLINMTHTNIWTACDLHDISFIDSKRGFMVGEKEQGVGYVYRTNDGGKTWRNERFVHFGFLSIDIFDSLHIAVSGHGGIMKLKSDGVQLTPTHIENDIFTDIHYINETTCIASGYSGAVYKSVDGGSRWECVYSDQLFSKLYWNAIHFVSPQHGFVCGENAALLETKDGGATWHLHSLEFNGDFNCITHTNNVLYIGTNTGVVITISNIL